MGAGRSGSTVLSTVLGSSKHIFNCAELIHLFEYGCTEKKCNDGNSIFASPFWSKAIGLCNFGEKQDYCKKAERNFSLERHNSFFKNLFGFTKKSNLQPYLNDQEKLIKSIAKNSGKTFIIDSSKYANRALLLRKMKNIEVKIIYNIRDSRGVINSFAKKTQTPKKSFSAILYYNLINLISEFVYLTTPKSKRMKIRYEDFILEQNKTLGEISDFLEINFNDMISNLNEPNEIEVGPVIGGNRIVKKKKISIGFDDEWIRTMGNAKKFVFYTISLPFMLINRYSISGR